MSSPGPHFLSAFRPCWRNRLRPVEDNGAHNIGFVRAYRWALPQVHAVIAGELVQDDVNDDVPFEDGERCRSRADSYVDLS
jgi:hypothetical protein